MQLTPGLSGSASRLLPLTLRTSPCIRIPGLEIKEKEGFGCIFACEISKWRDYQCASLSSGNSPASAESSPASALQSGRPAVSFVHLIGSGFQLLA